MNYFEIFIKYDDEEDEEEKKDDKGKL